MKRILTPKGGYRIQSGIPLFFLAGPVRGGGDWQRKCYELLAQYVPDFYAAIPYYDRTDKPYPLYSEAAGPDIPDAFRRQRDWEEHYMLHAAKTGCLIFWLPEEDPEDVRPPEDGPYARDTRFELGLWCAQAGQNHSFNVVVGGESGFSGLDIIYRNFESHHDPKNPQGPFWRHTDLEVTVASAVEKAQRQKQG